jgi:hypothetical protein
MQDEMRNEMRVKVRGEVQLETRAFLRIFRPLSHAGSVPLRRRFDVASTSFRGGFDARKNDLNF